MINRKIAFSPLRRFPGAALALGLALTAAAARAQDDFQDLAALREALHRFVLNDHRNDQYPPRVQVGDLDPRLRLRRCAQPRVGYADPRRRSGKIYGSVACAEPARWRIYVALSVDTFGDVLVTTRALPRGHTLQAGDLQVQKRNLAALSRGFLSDPARLQGWQTQRELGAGTALWPGAVAAPLLVRNGEEVTLIAGATGLQIVTRGRALADGAAGRTVRVRNSSTGKVVEGRVIGPGRVIVR